MFFLLSGPSSRTSYIIFTSTIHLFKNIIIHMVVLAYFIFLFLFGLGRIGAKIKTTWAIAFRLHCPSLNSLLYFAILVIKCRFNPTLICNKFSFLLLYNLFNSSNSALVWVQKHTNLKLAFQCFPKLFISLS